VAQSLVDLEVDARQNAFHRALEFRPLAASVGVETKPGRSECDAVSQGGVRFGNRPCDKLRRLVCFDLSTEKPKVAQ
jgi:hypothetical protein